MTPILARPPPSPGTALDPPQESLVFRSDTCVGANPKRSYDEAAETSARAERMQQDGGAGYGDLSPELRRAHRAANDARDRLSRIKRDLLHLEEQISFSKSRTLRGEVGVAARRRDEAVSTRNMLENEFKQAQVRVGRWLF